VALLVALLAIGAGIVGSHLLREAVAIPSGGSAVLVFDKYPERDLYTARADGTDLRRLTSGAGAEIHPVWSPDGTRIAYRLWQDGKDSIAVMDAGGGGHQTLATTEQPRQACSDDPQWEPLEPVWSPDGTSVIFTASAACDGGYDLFVVATDGTSPSTKLLAPGLQGASAAWSPVATRLAFVGKDDLAGEVGLYVVDVSPGEALAGGLVARRIADVGGSDLHSVKPDWSPDGTDIALAAGTTRDCIAQGAGTLDALVVKADGSGQRTLVGSPAMEFNPRWSPDGRRLVFQRIVDSSEWLNGRPCTMAPWIVDADGANERRLEGLSADDTQPPFWSPDGTRILGTTIGTAGSVQYWDLFVITVDETAPMVTLPDVGVATWQPVAAPLPPAPSFPTG
jgi:Tol biopolymer transport system component